MHFNRPALAHGLVWLLLVLPWVYPLASGPAPSTQQWLVSLGAAATLLLLFQAMPSLREPLPGIVTSSWIWAALLNAAMGLIQYFGLAQPLWPWVPDATLGQAYGALRQRNQFATLTLIGVAALLMRAQIGAPLWRVVAPALLLVTANAVSASRTGALGLLLLCCAPVLWPALRRREPLAVLGISVVGYLLATWLMPHALALVHGVHALSVFDRMESGAGCNSRLVMWANVAHLVSERPWTGWGWGRLDFAHYWTLYPGERFCDILDNAHMLPLHLAVELGLPFAVLASLAAIVLVLWRAPWRETQPRQQLAWLVVALLWMHSMVEYPLWYGPFCLGLGCAVVMLGKHGSAGPTRTGWRDAPGYLPAVALLVVTLVAAWDYWRVSQLYMLTAQRSPALREDTLAKVQDTWFFGGHVRFAELTTTPLTPATAPRLAALATDLLPYSPEPRVIEPLVESLVMLGRHDEALLHLARYRAAFPQDFEQWQAAQAARARQPSDPSSAPGAAR